MEKLIHDIRFGVRRLIKQPGFPLLVNQNSDRCGF
jgi:hypothetical protein